MREWFGRSLGSDKRNLFVNSFKTFTFFCFPFINTFLFFKLQPLVFQIYLFFFFFSSYTIKLLGVSVSCFFCFLLLSSSLLRSCYYISPDILSKVTDCYSHLPLLCFNMFYRFLKTLLSHVIAVPPVVCVSLTDYG